ncbi:hypothetical protein WH47_04233 [Habropoda laboriosa]|uniref:UPAR/Ly6 domain-containing protein n=1 Tax=Habropoda laboriosa TaxID=597456 RepID=A0A0L7QV97_9HYME|nr:hypothetical protein WH47_04233 [Habropoda laboriosa]
MKFSKFYWTLFITCCLPHSHALECYVCTNQDGNREKCLKSTKTCEQGQDTCLSDIMWGSTPYWSHGAKKQYYVSKKCATKKECERIKHSNMEACTYIWYQDWKCTDCCQGDRCNYYIIVSQVLSSVLILRTQVKIVLSKYIKLIWFVSVHGRKSTCLLVHRDCCFGIITQSVE